LFHTDVIFKEKTLKRLSGLDKTTQKKGWAKLKNSPEKKRGYSRISYKKDPLPQIIRVMLRRVLNGKGKTDSTEDIIGYNSLKLKQRLECQFTKGMSWENYGKWHIDHKKPVSAFVDKNPRIINMLCNLAPMWAKDNLKKKNTWIVTA
jgi:hypothetical protein